MITQVVVLQQQIRLQLRLTQTNSHRRHASTEAHITTIGTSEHVIGKLNPSITSSTTSRKAEVARPLCLATAHGKRYKKTQNSHTAVNTGILMHITSPQACSSAQACTNMPSEPCMGIISGSAGGHRSPDTGASGASGVVGSLVLVISSQGYQSHSSSVAARKPTRPSMVLHSSCAGDRPQRFVEYTVPVNCTTRLKFCEYVSD